MIAMTPARSGVKIVDLVPGRTPTQRPNNEATMPRLTVAEKRLLIENLQLEVTERTRKLRAQYALQAQTLRSRLEMRVNRIPKAMRKATVDELLQKYTSVAAFGPVRRVAGVKRQSLAAHEAREQTSGRPTTSTTATTSTKRVKTSVVPTSKAPIQTISRTKTAAAVASITASITAAANAATVSRSPVKSAASSNSASAGTLRNRHGSVVTGTASVMTLQPAVQPVRVLDTSRAASPVKPTGRRVPTNPTVVSSSDRSSPIKRSSRPARPPAATTSSVASLTGSTAAAMSGRRVVSSESVASVGSTGTTVTRPARTTKKPAAGRATGARKRGTTAASAADDGVSRLAHGAQTGRVLRSRRLAAA